MREHPRREGEASRRTGRIMFGVAVTAGVLAALAGLGGVGYALNAAHHAVGGTLASTPAGDEYGACTEYVNPHGQTIPPAGLTPPGTNPNGGENPDGFYQVGSTTGGDVTVTDLGSGTVFGPYPGGTAIKYTQAPGATPSAKTIGSGNGQAGAVTVHITGTGDFQIEPVGGGTGQTCLVPPPPK